MPALVEQTVKAIKYYACKVPDQFGDGNWLKQFILWIGALTGYLLGHDNYDLLIVLCIFVMIDWITGVMAAYKAETKITSTKLARTVVKLVVYLCLVIVAQLCGSRLGLQDLDKLLIAFYIATEAYSIIENADKMGVPVPSLFKQAIKGKLEKDEERKV